MAMLGDINEHRDSIESLRARLEELEAVVHQLGSIIGVEISSLIPLPPGPHPGVPKSNGLTGYVSYDMVSSEHDIKVADRGQVSAQTERFLDLTRRTGQQLGMFGGHSNK